MQIQKIKQNHWFTLVELIVVITILAILGTIAFISLQWYSTNARDSTRISDVWSMKTSLELFQLEAGKYPIPTDGVDITYSWATVWTQWSFWETVYANVTKLDKIPTDPLTDKEYTYSVISTRNEYEISWIIEWEALWMNNNLISQSLAWTVEATAYVSWNYNWLMTKTLNGNACKILSLPTILTNDTTVTDLQDIITQKRFVYNWFKNLASSFKWSKFKEDGWFDFQPAQLIAYSDTGSCADLTANTWSWTSARVTLLQWLQNSYSWTVIENEWEIKNVVNVVIDENNPSTEVVNLVWNLVNNNFWGKVVLGWSGNWSSSGGGWPTFTCWDAIISSWDTLAPTSDQWYTILNDTYFESDNGESWWPQWDWTAWVAWSSSFDVYIRAIWAWNSWYRPTKWRVYHNSSPNWLLNITDSLGNTIYSASNYVSWTEFNINFWSAWDIYRIYLWTMSDPEKITNIEFYSSVQPVNSSTVLKESYTTILWPDWKCWTSQNMRHGTFLNSNVNPSNSTSVEKWCNGNNTSNCSTYWAYYSRAEAMWFDASCSNTDCTWAEDTSKSVCGKLWSGWHLPTDSDWIAIKWAWATWWTWNKLSWIISSLSNIPWYRNNGWWFVDDWAGFWWLPEQNYSTYSYYYRMNNYDSNVYKDSYDGYKFSWFSVLCVKD